MKGEVKPLFMPSSLFTTCHDGVRIVPEKQDQTYNIAPRLGPQTLGNEVHVNFRVGDPATSVGLSGVGNWRGEGAGHEGDDVGRSVVAWKHKGIKRNHLGSHDC